MLLLVLIFLKIRFLVLWVDVTFQTESTVAYFWRELENTLYSSLDSYTFSLRLSILNPGVEGKLPLGNLGLVLVFFSQKQMVLPAEAMWKSLAPSCGLLRSELTKVPVPCCFLGIFLLSSEKRVFTFSVLNEWFSGAVLFASLLWGSSVAVGESKQGFRRFLCLGFV